MPNVALISNLMINTVNHLYGQYIRLVWLDHYYHGV